MERWINTNLQCISVHKNDESRRKNKLLPNEITRLKYNVTALCFKAFLLSCIFSWQRIQLPPKTIKLLLQLYQRSQIYSIVCWTLYALIIFTFSFRYYHATLCFYLHGKDGQVLAFDNSSLRFLAYNGFNFNKLYKSKSHNWLTWR